jgi:hypothetical protein
MIKSGRAGVRVDLISDILKCHRKTRQLRPGFSMTSCPPKGGKFKFVLCAVLVVKISNEVDSSNTEIIVKNTNHDGRGVGVVRYIIVVLL